MTRRRIGIVTPWYGPEATGGAETLARELATHLAVTDHVTVLTTTARSFHADWSADYFSAGRSAENGYDVHRFRLGKRDAETFDLLNGELMRMAPSGWPSLTRQREHTNPFIEESINSPELEDYLGSRHAGAFDAIVFLPYLYGVVVRGIEAYDGRAHLLPCLHDEAYARVPRIEDALHIAATLLFNSEGEAEFALRTYGPGILQKSHVIGSGLPPAAASVAPAAIDGAYFLCLGRRDATKGTDFLVDTFARYRRERSPATTLVLAGPGTASYHDPAGGIVDLGFVDDATKRSLIRGARALLQPSTNESYSRVIMEAWREEIAVVARAECLATSIAVQRSGGGLVAGDAGEWLAALARLDTAAGSERDEFGRRGAAYAAIHSDWSRVLERFRAATGLDAPAKPARRGKRVNQIVETLTYGDAISDYTRSVRSHLLASGYKSTIFARFIHPRVAHEATVLTAKAFASPDPFIFHHSIGSSQMDAIVASSAPKALIYHNITPAHFFREYDPAFADHLETGRAQLAGLSHAFTTFGADSEYNASELRDLGCADVTVIPVPLNLARFDVTPAPVPVPGAGAQWLFVGRISPNKGVRQLIEAFEVYACIDPNARLVLVGTYDAADRYYQDLTKLVVERELDSHVVFAGMVDDAVLTAYYRNADIFVCLSEHEGFCVPLVEAMFWDIPIVAKAGTAVTETLGDAGILMAPEADAFEFAAVAHEVHTDRDLRARIIASQRARRAAFLPERIFPIIDAFVAKLA